MKTQRPNIANKTLITQGEYKVMKGDDAVIATLLGSCVSTCLWDEVSGVGGMNHILLPDRKFGNAATGVSVNEMELLINGLIKAGADRNRLKAKLFGGAKMIAMSTDIGERNAAFAREFLAAESIECIGESTGGTTARQILFWPGSGKAMVRVAEEAPVEKAPEPVAEPASELELF